MNTASVIPFEGRLHTFEDPRRYLDEAYPGRPAPTPGAKTLLADIGLALANRDADAPLIAALPETVAVLGVRCGHSGRLVYKP